jgi:class 3 adenylate cyclase
MAASWMLHERWQPCPVAGRPEARKLAAILVAGIVGLSRLTSSDEDRTIARVRALRSDLVDPTIVVHRGRLVKGTGGGVLCEFRSVVETVRCALDLQAGLVERNAGLSRDPGGPELACCRPTMDTSGGKRRDTARTR